MHFSSIHAFSQDSSGATLDETRAPPDAHRVPAYDRSKAEAKRVVIDGLRRGLDAVIVNPTAVLGPFDFKPSAMGRVLLDLAHRRLPALVRGGFDWVDARDVATGALAAAEKGRSGERYLLSGEWLSIRDLAEIVEIVTGVSPPRFVAPMWAARIGAPFVAAWSKMLKTEPLFTSESLRALRGARRISHAKASAELGIHFTSHNGNGP